VPEVEGHICDRDCTPRDSVDAMLASWAQQRPDIDFGPVGVIARLARVRGHIDAELEVIFREFGLTQPNFEALVTLARIGDGDGVSQRRLADELGLTAGTVSVRVDRLIEQGLVDRKPDPRSKRNALIALTPAGREVFERVVPAHLANEERLLAALSDEDRQLLAGLLRKLLIEFEGSRPAEPDADRLGLVMAPAHVTIAMRAAVGLPAAAGLLVRAIAPDTPAARAGLQPGDVLTHAGTRELRSSASLYAAAREARNGRIPLTLLRGHDRRQTQLKLEPGCSINGEAATSHETGGVAEHTI
jgi:DNA-binding MarR family transcriptional regulator